MGLPESAEADEGEDPRAAPLHAALKKLGYAKVGGRLTVALELEAEARRRASGSGGGAKPTADAPLATAAGGSSGGKGQCCCYPTAGRG